jgi:hypothetical protein
VPAERQRTADHRRGYLDTVKGMQAATVDLNRHPRLRQVERRLLRMRTTLLFLRCVGLPAFGVVAVLILKHMLVAGAHVGLDTLAGGAFTLLVATTGLVTTLRAARRHLEELEAERSRLLQPLLQRRVARRGAIDAILRP